MGLFNAPLGINLTDNNILKVSPFINSQFSGAIEPPGPPRDLTTESGLDILTEGGDFITTE